MTIVSDRYIEAENLSEAWVDGVRFLLSQPSRKTAHLLIRILNPNDEIDSVRKEAQGLIDLINSTRAEKNRLYDVSTTRNTIFPAAWAQRNPEPEELAQYYRGRYHKKEGLRSFQNNGKGTYFGRIVAYPRGEEMSGDQLTETVRKLRVELATRQPKSSRYEINIYCEALDRSPTSFPCLAHISLHLHTHKLHMHAIYRNEYLIGRGYGNFLGLANLQAYMASAVDVECGELLLTVGHAELDSPTGLVKAMLERLLVS